MIEITLERFKQFAPRANPAWVPHLVEILPKFGINTPARIAAFLAQAAHESGEFTRLTENLNYGAAGLVKTFPNRFDRATAAAYARQPEKIANRAYSNKNGNGDEASGDGWKYRGRGIFQLTGRKNYRDYGIAVGKDWETNPDLVAEPADAVRSACCYWKLNGLSELADKGDFRELTRRINRALLNYEDRVEWHEKAKRIFV